MDKQLAFILIVFFVICAGFVTWSAFEGTKKDSVCKWLSVGYVALVWVLIIALTVVTILYR